MLLERKSAPKGQNRLVVLFCFFFFSFSLLSLSLSLSRRKKNKKGGKKSRFFLSSSLSFFLSVFLFLGSVP